MDMAPLDQLEKCRKSDDRHLGGRSRRCDEMSFLLHRSGSVGTRGGQPPWVTRPERRRSSVSTSSRATTGKPSRSRRRSSDLTDLEAEIDQLLMKVVKIGQLSEVEDSLRKARRQLYEGLAARS
jgi:hypothetical protein